MNASIVTLDPDKYTLKMHMGIHTDVELYNATSMPLISDVNKTFEIELRMHTLKILIIC